MSWARLVTNSHVWCLFLSWMDWRMHLMENCHHFRALKGANENYDKGHFILTSADSITIIIRLMVPWTIQWMLQYRLKVSRSFLETSFSKLDSSKFQGPRLKSNCEMFEAFWEIILWRAFKKLSRQTSGLLGLEKGLFMWLFFHFWNFCNCQRLREGGHRRWGWNIVLHLWFSIKN